MATGFEAPATAERLAKSIYDISTECLMAHSIRSVERYLRETYKFDTQIVLKPSKTVFPDMGRLSWCSVAANSGDLTYIFFHDDPEWDRNRKRFCIAHELYHVIWSVGSAANVPRHKMTESLCDLFANDLCRHHDAFYEEQAKAANQFIRFQGLPYRSV